MGKVGFSPFQAVVFDAFSEEPIASQFYFTGGTALSVFHFHHRISEDLDFFSKTDFSDDAIREFIENLCKRKNLSFQYTRRDKARIFQLVRVDKPVVKIDFVQYPYPSIETGTKVKSMRIDSLRDIATNKLLTINQRTDVKDFVDLYFLLRKFTIWDLIYGVEAKFGMEMDMVGIGSYFLKVKKFTFLPKMLVPLELKDLQEFFRGQAIEIGKRITKP